jgi:hypothetical protein
MEEWRYRSTILDLGPGWRLVFNFTLLPFYPLGNTHRRLSGPQSRARRYGEEKNLLFLPGIEP